MSDDIRNQLKNGVSSHVLNEEYEHSKKQIMEHAKFVSTDTYEQKASNNQVLSKISKMKNKKTSNCLAVILLKDFHSFHQGRLKTFQG